MQTQPPIAKEPIVRVPHLTGMGLSEAVLKRGCGRDAWRGKKRPGALLLLALLDWLGQARVVRRGSDRPEENKTNWKTLSHSSPIPLFATPPFLFLPHSVPHSLFFFILELLSWKRGDRHGQSLELRHW